jgi:hypothetical protein
MQITNEELARHYASLSDGELEDINPADLTDAGRKVYEAEIARRRLTVAARRPPVQQDLEDGADTGAAEIEEIDEDEEPDWLEEAVCVCSFRDPQRSSLARDALRSSGVPSHLVVAEPAVDSGDAAQDTEYQVMTPSSLHLRAKTVLDIQFFNQEIEDGLRTHLAELSDEEFQALDAEDICGGARDLLERLTQVYEEEVARRG